MKRVNYLTLSWLCIIIALVVGLDSPLSKIFSGIGIVLATISMTKGYKEK